MNHGCVVYYVEYTINLHYSVVIHLCSSHLITSHSLRSSNEFCSMKEWRVDNGRIMPNNKSVKKEEIRKNGLEVDHLKGHESQEMSVGEIKKKVVIIVE